jgi:hypothetical protein
MWIARSFRRLSRAEGWTTTEWQTWQADAIFNGTGREAVDGHFDQRQRWRRCSGGRSQKTQPHQSLSKALQLNVLVDMLGVHVVSSPSRGRIALATPLCSGPDREESRRRHDHSERADARPWRRASASGVTQLVIDGLSHDTMLAAE